MSHYCKRDAYSRKSVLKTRTLTLKKSLFISRDMQNISLSPSTRIGKAVSDSFSFEDMFSSVVPSVSLSAEKLKLLIV